MNGLLHKPLEPKVRVECKPVSKGDYCMGCGGPEGSPRLLWYFTIGCFLTVRACRSCADLMFHKYTETR